jgi:hypothetical protein
MRLLRIALGVLLASYAGAVAMGWFAHTPRSLKQAPSAFFDTLGQALKIAPFVTPSIVVSALLPAALILHFAERHRIRSWLFYIVVCALASSVSYLVVHAFGLAPIASRATNFGIVTFAGVGTAFGLAYWFFAGRYAGDELARDRRLLPEIARNTRKSAP